MTTNAKTKITRETTAKEAHKIYADTIRIQLKLIEAMLEKSELEFSKPENQKNWGYAGDLEHMYETLSRITNPE